MAKANPGFAQGTLRNILIASLAVNVFLAGFVFARVLGPERGVPSPEPLAINLRGLPQDIPPQVREGLEQGFKPHRREVERAYRDLIRARIEIGEILNREDFSPEELERALKKVRELQIKIQGPLHQAFVESMKHLNAHERREFVFSVDSMETGGFWAPRRFDGARWRVELADGKIIFDLKGLEKIEIGDDNEGAE